MISRAEANNYLDTLFGNSDSMARPDELYLGLCSVEPAHGDGTVTGEPTAASYARVPVGGRLVSTKYFSNANMGIIMNAKEIHFNVAREAWSTASNPMRYFFLSNSSTGKARIWGELIDESGTPDPLIIDVETVPVFYTGYLRASIDVPLT